MAFKKGDPNINRKGRPKDGKSWASVLDRIGEEQIQVKGEKMTRKEGICRLLYKKAAKGENYAINAIMDRIEGKPLAKVEQQSETIVRVSEKIVDVEDAEN